MRSSPFYKFGIILKHMQRRGVENEEFSGQDNKKKDTTSNVENKPGATYSFHQSAVTLVSRIFIIARARRFEL